MSDLMRDVLRQYAAILPEDRRDLEWFMSADTRDMFATMDWQSGGFGTTPTTLLGAPVRIDENIPSGVVHARTETELDRAVRRAARDGHALNVMQPVGFPMPILGPAPDPTLKALLRHWLKRLRKILS